MILLYWRQSQKQPCPTGEEGERKSEGGREGGREREKIPKEHSLTS